LFSEFTNNVLKSKRLNLLAGNSSKGLTFFLGITTSSFLGASFLGASFLGASFLGYYFTSAFLVLISKDFLQ